jgi:hypothetical protein
MNIEPITAPAGILRRRAVNPPTKAAIKVKISFISIYHTAFHICW